MIFTVPYRPCLRLVAARRVTLRHGVAVVPCGSWRALLAEVFRLHLLLGYEDMTRSGCHAEALHDPRVRPLAQLLRHNFHVRAVVDSVKQGFSTFI